MKPLSSAIFPGSFDPLTNGHVDIIERSLRIFDKLIVAVLSNPDKDTLFTVAEREEIIRNALASYGDRVVTQSFSGLLVEYVRRSGARVIIRGLRAISDYDYEAQMALTNRALASEIETFFLITSEQNAYISSSVVRQVAQFGGDVSKMVPASVAEALKRKVRSRG